MRIMLILAINDRLDAFSSPNKETLRLAPPTVPFDFTQFMKRTEPLDSIVNTLITWNMAKHTNQSTKIRYVQIIIFNL